MCRLLGYVTAEPASITHSLGAPLFDQFTALCAIHADGWGMGWRTPQGPEIATSHLCATTDPRFAELAGKRLSDAGLVHLRWATDGLAVNPENTHPFTAGGYAFAHNGNVSPIPQLESLLGDEAQALLRGTTDSERYFAYLWQEIAAADDEATALQDAVSRLHQQFPTRSLNALLLSPTTLYAIHVNNAAVGPIDDVIAMYSSADEIPLGHADSSGYFAMAYRETPEAVHVISSGISPEGWEPVPADSILAIDVQTRDVGVLAIAPATVPGSARGDD